MSYRSAESLIRQIMAESAGIITPEHPHTPALKIPDETRVDAAIEVLHNNGCPSAKRRDEHTIEIAAGEANMAGDVLDRALVHDTIKVKPTLVSAESIPMPDQFNDAQFKAEEVEEDPELRAAEETAEIKRIKAENKLKKVDEEQQIDEISKSTAASYIMKATPKLVDKAHDLGRAVQNPLIDGKKYSRETDNKKMGIIRAAKTLAKEEVELNELSYSKLKSYETSAKAKVAGGDSMDKRIARHKAGLEKVKAAKIAKVSKAAFAESVSPTNTVLRIISEAAGLRLVATHNSECGKHSAKVYKDAEWGEHRVKFFIGGKHHEPADYHTDHVDDAHHTARSELTRLTKLNGALKEATEEEINALVEDFEQIDELSKATVKNYMAASSDRQDSVDDKISSGERVARKDLKRANNAANGAALAAKKLHGGAKVLAKEAAEDGELPFQLDELSTKTLDGYRQKAMDSVMKHREMGAKFDSAAKSSEHSKMMGGVSKMHYKAAGKRMKNIRKADDIIHDRIVKQMTTKEEVEPIEELSRSTLADYVIKASASKHGHEAKGSLAGDKAKYHYHMSMHDNKGEYKPSTPRAKASDKADSISRHHFKKADNRSAGLEKAIPRLANIRPVKEEVELTEAKKSDEVEKSKKHLMKHPEANAIGRSIHHAAKHFTYTQDAVDHVYNNHHKDVDLEDFDKMKPHLEDTFKKQGLK